MAFLDGYTKEEGRSYIEWKLRKAGCADSKLCNAALVIGHSQSAARITNEMVMQAINDSISTSSTMEWDLSL